MSSDLGPPVSDVRARLGEGPVWDPATGSLLWVDILAGLVHRFTPGRGSDLALDIRRHVGAVAPRVGGGLVLAASDGFRVADAGAVVSRLLAPIGADQTGIRMNDGSCDAAGRFWAGTLAYDARPGSGALYRLDPDGSAVLALEGLTISNGIAWSPDNRTMYLIDTATYRVDAFDFDLGSGALSRRRTVVVVDPSDGMPDGLAVDADGHLWIAMWDGWAVRRYTPDGIGELELRLPVARVTSVAFGGPQLDELYVTTAWDGLSDVDRALQPAAGGLFQWRSTIPGLPPSPFAG